jgi:hypothetical protein
MTKIKGSHHKVRWLPGDRKSKQPSQCSFQYEFIAVNEVGGIDIESISPNWIS